MKSRILTVLSLAATLSYALPSFATVDVNTKAWIVVQHVQMPDRYMVQQVPVLGCIGLAQGPQLSQWTAAFSVKDSHGCGMPQIDRDINALSCGKVVEAKESQDYYSFSEITLDISACAAKENPRFIAAIQNTAKLNFKQMRGNPPLKLILKK